MQSVSSSYAGNVAAAVKRVGFGVSISWLRQISSTTRFFTIGVSQLDGTDGLKGGGAAPAFFDKYQYADSSKDVMSWSVERKLGQYPYGVIMALADVTLDNSANRYTPGYDPTIGSYILPNRPLRISASIEGDSLGQFIGFIDDPVSTLSSRSTSLQAYDAMEYINGFKSALPLQVGLRADAIIAAGLAEMGFASTQYALEPSLAPTIAVCAPYGKTWGSVFQALAEAEQALLFVDENGIIRFWNRQHIGSSTTSVQSFTFDNILDLEPTTTPIINDVTVVASPRELAENQLVWSLVSTVNLAAGATTAIWTDFTDEDGELPVTTVDSPTAVGPTSQFTAEASDGSDASSSISLVSIGLYGTTALVVLQNTSSAAVVLTNLVLWGTPFKVAQVIDYRLDDSTSIGNYGRNPGTADTITIQNDYVQDASSAAALAYALVNGNKLPRRRYTVPIFPNPALQFGDVVTVTNALTSETKSMYITGSTTAMSPDRLMNQTLEVEEYVVPHYFIIGVSHLDGTDGLAP